MRPAFALLPSAVVIAGVLWLRWSGLAAAAAALLTTGAIWLAGAFHAPSLWHARNAIADAAVLTLLVAAMTVPGILFVEATRSRKSTEAIAAVIAALRLDPARSAMLIALGLGVLVESLTGMGVSLLVTMPLLLRVTDRTTAIALGLIGMSLMPWGALAISAQLGAKLAGIPVETLAASIVLVSGPVAACLPLLATLALAQRRLADFTRAIATGAVLVAAIAMATRFVGIEVAGVFGGLAVCVLMAAGARAGDGLWSALRAPGLRPYVWLIGLVMAQKLLLPLAERLALSPVIATERVEFAPLTSPGVALLLATLVTSGRALGPAVAAAVAARAWRPTLAIALFMLAARLLIEAGAIASMAGLLQGLGSSGAVVAVVLLGAVGGFATGSGVTGNALFMPSAAAVGQNLGNLPLFAALQNGASGHVGIAALPVAALLLASMPDKRSGEDRIVMRTGMLLAAWHLVVLTAAGLVLLR